jgi:hypothetical protein
MCWRDERARVRNNYLASGKLARDAGLSDRVASSYALVLICSWRSWVYVDAE